MLLSALCASVVIYFMLKMRQILTLIFVFLLDWGTSLLAQDDLKYKDIFSLLQSSKKEDIYPLLKAYQGKDPLFANAYYQLGLINEDWAKSYDPLTQHEQVDYFMYNTRLFFGLAKHYLDEKQARRYKEYFNKVKPAAGKTEPGFKEIQDDLIEHLNSIEVYKLHVDQTYRFFTQSVSHYNKCVALFMNICGSQKMLKEIYLTANDSLIQQTKILKEDYDSAIINFDKFRMALDSFPLKNYKQQKLIRSIETYRLDGLTGSDFTKDTVPMWNYREWVINLETVLNTEIKDLRLRLDSTNKRLDDVITLFLKKSEPITPVYHLPKIDPILRNKLEKIDFGSTALQCIIYKHNLLQFITLCRDSLNNPFDSLKQISIMRKGRYYRDLVKNKQLVDSLLLSFSNSTTVANIKKYDKFFEVNFPGNATLINYLNNQKILLSSFLDKSFDFFSDYLVHYKQNTSVTGDLIWKKIPVSHVVIAPGQTDPLLTDHYQANVSRTDKAGNIYLAGTLIQAGKKAVAFIAFAEKSKAVSWLRTFDMSEKGMDFYNYALNLELTNNGCFAVISSLFPGIDSVSVTNTIVRLDLKGNELFRKKINPGSVMRWFLFDDINNKLFTAFQGKKVAPTEIGPADLTFSALDSAGNAIWNYSEKIEGQLSDIIRTDNNWLIYCNVSGYSSDNKWISVKDEKDQASKGILSILIDSSGKQVQFNQYKQSNPAVMERLIKLNSETLNILGFRNKNINNPGSPGDNPGKLVYILVDKKGNPIYTY